MNSIEKTTDFQDSHDLKGSPDLKDSKDMSDGSETQKVTQVSSDISTEAEAEESKKKWYSSVFEMGSATQIVIAATLAIAIGMAVTTTVDEVPDACRVILAIPGVLWLRALKAIVLPLIATAIILAVQRLREMSEGAAKLARWTIGWYVGTTLLAIAHSTILVSQGWIKIMAVVDEESLGVSNKDKALYAERSAVTIQEVIADMFNSLVTDNIVSSFAENGFLAILVAAVVIGYLIKGPNSPLLKAIIEIEAIITTIITFLIKLAPIGVFFLILPNLFKLDIAEIGQNLGVLIGGSVTGMLFHLLVVLPALFFIIVRQNPWSYWFKCSPAWLTAWGTASSAATLPITIKCVRARGIPETIIKFTVPLGCLINMDGTAIYFPIVVVFMAATQGITLTAADYIIIILLSTLASIGTTPIPSSSLVLTVMIAGSVNVPITGMYAVVVAIDWFLDRFRTAVNVSGDLYAAAILTKITGITDDDDDTEFVMEEPRESFNNGSRV